MFREGDGAGRWDCSLSWLAGALLLASLAVAGWAYLRDGRFDAGIGHDNALVIASERLLSSLKDVGTGQRGFVITDRDEYLEPYRWGLAAAPADLATVLALGGSEAAPLSDLVGQRLAEAARDVEVSQTEGSVAGAERVRSDLGKSLMDRVRVGVAALQKDADLRVAAARRDRGGDDLLRALALAG